MNYKAMDHQSHRLGGSTKKRFIMPISLIGIIVIGIGIWLNEQQDLIPLPTEIVEAATSTIYLPSPLPNGYFLDKTSPRVDQGTVFYTLRNNSANQAVTISIQSKPAGFDAKPLVAQRVATEVASPLGAAYNASTEDKSTYILVTTDKTLIFMNSESKIDDATMTTLLASLKPIKNL